MNVEGGYTFLSRILVAITSLTTVTVTVTVTVTTTITMNINVNVTTTIHYLYRVNWVSNQPGWACHFFNRSNGDDR